MLKATWPHHFGNIATPQLWQEVHQLSRANEEQPERELIFLNHDLVGFFNSIPQADIIQSNHYLIAEFSKSNNDILLIDPHSKLNPVHSGKSTHSIKSNMTKINALHIVDIIQFSFDACAFTAIGEVFRQTCGTSMGNQISPILSTCAIVSTEITWLRLYGQYVASAHLADQLWIRRYVDNRAIIVDTPRQSLHLATILAAILPKSLYNLRTKTVTISWASASTRTTDRSATFFIRSRGDIGCLSQQARANFDSADITAGDI